MIKAITKTLKKLFPPNNELTTFVIAVTLISLFFYMEGWYTTAIDIVSDHFSQIFYKPSHTGNILDSFVWLFINLFLIPGTVFCCIIAPLVLPFVRTDLRELCVWVLVIDLILISVHTIKLAHNTRDILHFTMATYCVLWMLYFYWQMKTEKIDNLISREKHNPKVLLLTAVLVTTSVFVAIKYFNVHWITAYSASLAIIANLITVIFPAPTPTDTKNSFSNR